MSEFINTVDVLGDAAVVDSIIDRSIVEFKDNTTKIIADYAFATSKLETVDLPRVTAMGTHAFHNCTALKSVNLPNATDKYNSAYGAFFEGCSALEKLVLPKLKSTGVYGFAYSGVKYVDLGALTHLDVYAFTGCSKLETLIIRTQSVVPLGGNIFGYMPSGLVDNGGFVYVPKSILEGYKAATGWCDYTEYLRAIEDYPEITGG